MLFMFVSWVAETNYHSTPLFIHTETLSVPDVSPSCHGLRAGAGEGAPETQETSEENRQVCAQHSRSFSHTHTKWFCCRLFTVAVVTICSSQLGGKGSRTITASLFALHNSPQKLLSRPFRSATLRHQRSETVVEVCVCQLVTLVRMSVPHTVNHLSLFSFYFPPLGVKCERKI